MFGTVQIIEEILLIIINIAIGFELSYFNNCRQPQIKRNN
jgi:hypothetical protein